MKWKNSKFVYIAMVICVTVCVVTYAGKCKLSKSCLSLEAKAALDALYPNAEIEETEVEKEGLKIYEVELEQNDREIEVMLAKDGTLIEVETEITAQGLPEAVAKAIAEAAEGATIKEVSREVTYAVVKLVSLDQPQTSYEAELSKQGAECEIEVAADGTILEQSKWKKCDEHKGHEHKCKSHGEHDDN
ncbi:MAG: PepSY-like domain-containing protein [Planctomycetota bacterium]|jgi:uncharacterized membrane protein YkoI